MSILELMNEALDSIEETIILKTDYQTITYEN